MKSTALILALLLPLGAQSATKPTIHLPAQGLSLPVPAGMELERPGTARPATALGAPLVRLTGGEARLELRALRSAAKLDQLIDQALADARSRGAAGQTPEWKLTGAKRARRAFIREGETLNVLGYVDREGSAVSFIGSMPANDEALRTGLIAALDGVRLGTAGAPFASKALDLSLTVPQHWGLVEDATGKLAAFSTRGRQAWVHVGPKETRERTPAQWGMELRDRLQKRVAGGTLENLEMTQIPAADGGAEGLRLAGEIVTEGNRMRHALETRLGRVIWIEADALEDVIQAQAMLASLTSASQTNALAGGTPGRFPTSRGPQVRFTLPKGWKIQQPSSSMRLANVVVEGPPQVTVAVFWFGAGGGGPVDMNIDRWKGQFGEDAQAKTSEVSLGGTSSAVLVDITGRYIAETTPGSGQRVNKPGQRMLGAILDVPQGPLFFKATGPIEAINAISPIWEPWIKSFRTL